MSEPVTFEAHLPKNCVRCETPMVVNHPDRPGGISHYCPTCDEHVRVLFGLVPVRLKRCPCGAFTRISQSTATWACRECKRIKFGQGDLTWLKGCGIVARDNERQD